MAKALFHQLVLYPQLRLDPTKSQTFGWKPQVSLLWISTAGSHTRGSFTPELLMRMVDIFPRRFALFAIVRSLDPLSLAFHMSQAIAWLFLDSTYFPVISEDEGRHQAILDCIFIVLSSIYYRP